MHKGVSVPVILCHQDSYQLKLGSNHADVLHWFKKYGKTMYDVRQDVYKIMNRKTKPKEEEVTQEQFDKMLNNYLVRLSKEQPSDWSKEARKYCEDNGIISGDSKGNKMYKKFLTREEMAALIYRIHGPKK